MNSPRTSSKPYFSAALTVLATSSLQLARAEQCSIDQFGNEHCSLTTGEWIGIAISIVGFLFFVLLLVVGSYRRRRMMRTNMMYVNQQQQQQQPYGGNGQYPYGNGQPGYNPTNAQQQQYPPPQTQGYGGGYAPPAGPPPAQEGSYYHSPQSPPSAHHNAAQGHV